MKISDLLTKADEQTLQTLLGSAILQLLQLLETNLTHPAKLQEILLTLHCPEELLLSKPHRDILLDLLNPQQAKILTTILEAPLNEDVYQALKQVRIRKNSPTETSLFNFFEIPIISTPQAIPETPASVTTSPQYSLFTHQRLAASKVKKYLSQTPRRGLLHLPTGAGKTRTAMNIIADYLRTNEPTLVVWLVYSKLLLYTIYRKMVKKTQINFKLPES